MHLTLLFFTNGPAVSADEKIVIAELAERGYPVCYRNAQFVNDFEIPEKHDGAGGHVPKAYADSVTFEDAIAAYELSQADKRAALDAIVGVHKVDDAPVNVTEVESEKAFASTAGAMASEPPKTTKPAKPTKAKPDAKPADAKVAPVWNPN